MATLRSKVPGSGARWGGIAVLAVAVAFGIAACGGGGGSSSSTSASGGGSTSASGGGGQSVPIKETDFKLNPSDPSVKAGNVTFDVSNDGATTHSLEVEGPNGDQTLKTDLAPGDSGALTVDLSKPGKYTFYCPIDSHRQMGMEGQITVQ